MIHVTSILAKIYSFNSEALIASIRKYKPWITQEAILADWEEKRERGTLIHKVIETILYYIDINQQYLMLSTYMLKPNEYKYRKDVQRMVNNALNYLQTNRLRMWNIEATYTYKNITGTIDLIAVDTNNMYHIIDWKTSQSRDINKRRYASQMAFYAFLHGNIYAAHIVYLDYYNHYEVDTYNKFQLMHDSVLEYLDQDKLDNLMRV